jgi:hypothetical protein
MRRFSTSPLPVRHDGWTVCRQLDFLEALARTRSVTLSARAVGMSRESAYRLRGRPHAALFAAAWDRAIGAHRHNPVYAEVDEGHMRAIRLACRAERVHPRSDPRSNSTS